MERMGEIDLIKMEVFRKDMGSLLFTLQSAMPMVFGKPRNN